MNPPNYRGYEIGPDFDRARSQIATPFQYIDIPLDVATANQVFNVSGDFLYIDPAYDGAVTLELNNEYNDPAAPFFCQSGWALQAVFKKIKLSWKAQPGKKIRLMYSTGERVVPAFSAQISIGGTVNTVSSGINAANWFKDHNPMTALNPVQVFSAASNTKGAVIHRASLITLGTGAPHVSMIAKATPPASSIDGNVMLSPDNCTNGTTYNSGGGKIETPLNIPAGLGLFFISQYAEQWGFRSCAYTLL